MNCHLHKKEKRKIINKSNMSDKKSFKDRSTKKADFIKRQMKDLIIKKPNNAIFNLMSQRFDSVLKGKRRSGILGPPNGGKRNTIHLPSEIEEGSDDYIEEDLIQVKRMDPSETTSQTSTSSINSFSSHSSIETSEGKKSKRIVKRRSKKLSKSITRYLPGRMPKVKPNDAENPHSVLMSYLTMRKDISVRRSILDVKSHSHFGSIAEVSDSKSTTSMFPKEESYENSFPEAKSFSIPIPMNSLPFRPTPRLSKLSKISKSKISKKSSFKPQESIKTKKHNLFRKFYDRYIFRNDASKPVKVLPPKVGKLKGDKSEIIAAKRVSKLLSPDNSFTQPPLGKKIPKAKSVQKLKRIHPIFKAYDCSQLQK